MEKMESCASKIRNFWCSAGRAGRAGRVGCARHACVLSPRKVHVIAPLFASTDL